MSELNVDTINEQTSANGVTIDGVLIKDGQVDGVDVSGITSGKILQVKSQFFDTQTSIASTTAFTDTGLTLSITPSATTSKILVAFYVSISGNDNSYAALKMFRDSTEIGSSTQTGTGIECFTGTSFRDTGNGSYSIRTIPMVFLDTPSSTSALTYKVQASPMRSSSSFSLYLNRSYNLGDDNQFRGVSNVILMEVSG